MRKNCYKTVKWRHFILFVVLFTADNVTLTGWCCRSVRVLVVGPRTLFCAAIITETDRGRYQWPKSVAGSTVHQLPCIAGPASEHRLRSNVTATARYRCVSPGRWTDLDVSRCQYTDHVTRLLADIAAVSDTHRIEYKTSGQRISRKGRIAELSPLPAANGFVRSWSPSESAPQTVSPLV